MKKQTVYKVFIYHLLSFALVPPRLFPDVEQLLQHCALRHRMAFFQASHHYFHVIERVRVHVIQHMVQSTGQCLFDLASERTRRGLNDNVLVQENRAGLCHTFSSGTARQELDCSFKGKGQRGAHTLRTVHIDPKCEMQIGRCRAKI